MCLDRAQCGRDCCRDGHRILEVSHTSVYRMFLQVHMAVHGKLVDIYASYRVMEVHTMHHMKLHSSSKEYGPLSAKIFRQMRYKYEFPFNAHSVLHTVTMTWQHIPF